MKIKFKEVKPYSIPNLGIESLVGKKVIDAVINEDKNIIVLETNSGFLFLSWVGDCCAECYLAHINGAENLIGGLILEANNSEWSDVSRNEEYEVIESMGTNIKTDKGYVTFESRVSHNGYYGGRINVSDMCPADQYSWQRVTDPSELELQSLKDF